MTPEQIAIVRAAAEAEAVRCIAKADELDGRGAEWSPLAYDWRKMATVWRDEAERRLCLGFDACNGWCGVRLERAA